MSGSLKFNEGDRQRQREGGRGGGRRKGWVLSTTLLLLLHTSNGTYSFYLFYFTLSACKGTMYNIKHDSCIATTHISLKPIYMCNWTGQTYTIKCNMFILDWCTAVYSHLIKVCIREIIVLYSYFYLYLSFIHLLKFNGWSEVKNSTDCTGRV